MMDNCCSMHGFETIEIKFVPTGVHDDIDYAMFLNGQNVDGKVLDVRIFGQVCQFLADRAVLLPINDPFVTAVHLDKDNIRTKIKKGPFAKVNENATKIFYENQKQRNMRNRARIKEIDEKIRELKKEKICLGEL